MTVQTALSGVTDFQPKPVRPGDDRFVGLAAEIGRQIAPQAAQHDRENTFVYDSFSLMKDSGYLRMTVPEELGGLGASLRQLSYAQAELAKYDASTALAVNMHLYLTLMGVYRWRHGAAEVEASLRRVASDGAIIMTSGGSDGIWPTAKATRVDGGYRVTGRKTFCSQAPVANVILTTAVHDDPENGPVILMLNVPTKSEGLKILETWDTLGMRATASNDVQLDDVMVTDAQIAGRRPWGKIDPIVRTAAAHFTPSAAAVYFGVAAGARNEAIRVVRERRRGDGQLVIHDPTIQRQVGLMDHKLRASWWTIVGALDELGDEVDTSETAMNAVEVTKRFVMDAAIEVVDLAMETVGGSAFFKRSPLERAYRDVRAGKFHPLTSEKALVFAGRFALGLPVDEVW